MADDHARMEGLRAIRAALIEQLLRLEQFGEMRGAAELSPAIEHLNRVLGDEPSEEEIDRLRRNYFMS